MLPGTRERQHRMFQDAHGLDLIAASATAVQAFDHALTGCPGYRAATPQRLATLLDTDAEFGLAHCRDSETTGEGSQLQLQRRLI
jgi:hypothetical protein